MIETGLKRSSGESDLRFRQTVQRTMILDVVKQSDEHLTAGEVFERVRQRIRGSRTARSTARCTCWCSMD